MDAPKLNSGLLFKQRAEQMADWAIETDNPDKQLVFLLMAIGYREMAARAQPALN